MQSALDIRTHQLALLKTLELELVCELIANIVAQNSKAAAIGCVLWDRDFEAFSETYRFSFGEQAEALTDCLDVIANESSSWPSEQETAFAINHKLFESYVKAEVLPMVALKVETDGEPVALIVVAGDADLTAERLLDEMAHFALREALSNAYEVSELRKEVDRLREQYELLEIDLHEQKKLTNELAGTVSPASVRLEQNDKEKLVYEISNAVRSSLDPAEVLQTAVNKIGAAFKLSRCLVIWPTPESDDYAIYEYADSNVPPCKQLFFEAEGNNFVRSASSKTAPHNFADEGEYEEFDRAYLQKFGFLSGMLVPLIYHDRNIGTLFLHDCTTPREWSIDNTALLGSLADLITVAIEHANIHEEKKRQAVTDGLTGIANRRHFNDTLNKEFERATRYGNSLSLVIVDLDFLKKINDTYGHHIGDAAIKSIGGVLAKSCRSVDTAARYGGEEFCLLLPDTETHDAVRLAERVRARIAETFIEGPGNISASIGVATFPTHAAELDALFEAADQALYAAKQGGRNQVKCAPELGSH